MFSCRRMASRQIQLQSRLAFTILEYQLIILYSMLYIVVTVSPMSFDHYKTASSRLTCSEMVLGTRVGLAARKTHQPRLRSCSVLPASSCVSVL